MTEPEAKSLLSNLAIKTPLSKIPLLNVVLSVIINEIVNTKLFAFATFRAKTSTHLQAVR